MYSPISRNYYRSSYHYEHPNYTQRNGLEMQQIHGSHPQYWNTYHHPYPTDASLQYGNPYYFQTPQGYTQQQQPNNQHLQQPTNHPSYTDIVFQNPLLASDEKTNFLLKSSVFKSKSILSPIPQKASFLAKPPSGVQSVLNSFKSQDGTLDVNEMVDTAGQMVNAVYSSVFSGQRTRWNI